MGLFAKLFKKDPQEELARLEALAGRGDFDEKALKQAQKLEQDGDPAVAARATAVAARFKDAHAADCLERARRSEEAGRIEDALDWMQAAHPYLSGDRRAALEARIDALAAGLDEDAGKPLISSRGADPREPENDAVGIDFDMHFEMLMGMLVPEAASRYEKMPRAFHEAYVDINNGMHTQAAEILDTLLAERPAEPVLQLERARCALFAGEFAMARTLLEQAWPTFGDGFIDEAGSLCVPALWAEAVMGLDLPGEAADRLESLADPAAGRLSVCQTYALALEAADRLSEARAYLIKAGTRFERIPTFPFILARVLCKLDEPQAAVRVLEHSVGPSCASGNCAPTAKHPASIRTLIELYLSLGDNLPRAGELLMHLEAALGGDLTRTDLLLAAAYHHQTGDEQAARAAEEEAARLEDAQDDAMHTSVTGSLDAGNKAVL